VVINFVVIISKFGQSTTTTHPITMTRGLFTFDANLVNYNALSLFWWYKMMTRTKLRFCQLNVPCTI